MTRVRMENLYKALKDSGTGFHECDIRIMNKCQGGKDDAISVGILRNTDGSNMTDKRFKEIMEIAKKKKTYALLRPEKSVLRLTVNGKPQRTELNSNDMVVCFIQAGIVDTFVEAYAYVYKTLKRHFLHFQEDEEIIELEKKLTNVTRSLRDYEQSAYELILLRTFSNRLIESVADEGIVFTRTNEIVAYMNGPFEQMKAETLCLAGLCLLMACK